jgi:DNA-binding LacI/PurR family transcriptional regulator
MKIPKRISLITQAAETIDAEMRLGGLAGRLPPERELALNLQVSRPTLRAALAVLEQQGKIKKGGRLGHLIVANHKSVPMPSNSRSIGILYCGNEWALSPAIARYLLKIQQCLHNAGYEMDAHFQRVEKNTKSFSKITELVEKHLSSCWLLIGGNANVQNWFKDKKIPVAVIGSTSEALGLPNFDVDYRATCRHAGQLLWRRGHRRISMIAPASDLRGDKMSELGFLEGLSQVKHSKGSIQILRYAGDVESIKRILDKAMSGEKQPTALLITRPTAVLTALGYLQGNGFKVPQDVSIISRDHEEFLSHLTPLPARYVVDWLFYGARVAKCLLHLAESGVCKVNGKMIFPTFDEGGTLASMPIGN